MDNSSIFIPIGNSCSIAYQLQKHGLRKTAYPFDWLKIKRLKTITYIIDNMFNGFTDFTELDRTTKYPLIKDDILDETEKNGTIKAINGYNIVSCHDFSSLIPFEEQNDEIKKKYQRRINRFYDVLLNGKQKIIFVRDETCKITKDEIMDFMVCIRKINPKLDFKIRIICRKDTCDFEIKPNEILEIIHDTKEYGDWKRPNVEWLNVFQYV